jgi:predicted permease
MKEIWQDLRYGARALIKNTGFTVVVVITLALGIGANTAIFTVVNAVLLRPLPYPESEKLIQLGRGYTDRDLPSDLSVPKFVFLRDNVQSFEAVAATQGLGPNVYLSDENQTEYINGLVVSADFFRVLGVFPERGRSFTRQEDSPSGERVAILGDRIWRSRFGEDQGIIGKTITLNGAAHTVVGIMPPDFRYLGAQDVLIPTRFNPSNQNEGHNWLVIGRLKRGATQAQAHSELKSLFEKFRATYPNQVKENEIFSLASWRASMTNSIRDLLWILFGAVNFILLIACVNVANLQLTRAASRQREMAIRIAMGASGWRLIRQLLTECMILALMGGLMGLFLAVWGLRAMLKLIPQGLLPRATEIGLDWQVFAFALGASLLTGVIFGLVPALQTLRVDVNLGLKEGGGKSSLGNVSGRLRKALVVIEFALALALTISSGLMLRTFANLRGIEPGFEARNVLTFEVTLKGKNYDTAAKMNDFYRLALERFRGLPGVEHAALTNKLPLDAQFNLPYRLAGQSKIAGAVQYRLISPDYFRVMKMAVRQGRPFNEGDTATAEPVAIVNEAFARLNFAAVGPLDQQLCVGCEYGDPLMRRIVGVVNETKQKSLAEASPPAVFIPAPQTAENVKQVLQQANFTLRTAGDPALLGAAVISDMRQHNSAVPIRNMRLMEDLVNRAIAPQRFNLFILGLFGALGLLLAAVGIYGVMAYSVSQRTDEIGLRMALGAQSLDVLKLIVKQGMTMALAGVAIGLIASFALTQLVKSLLFGVSATDPLTFIAVSLMLAAVALFACWIPARRATKVDPIVALRCE